MNKNLVNIHLHGVLGEEIGESWNLAVKSLSEAIRFIESTSKKFYKTLYDFDKKGIRYEIIINGRKFTHNKELTLDNLEDVKNSELMMKVKDLKTIDIVPVLEGADSDILQAVLGVVLIVVGAFTSNVALISAGITLLASGVVGLLTKPPKFEDFREIEQGGKTSYLFSGPANIIGEGGPVPVGYGRLMVGSQVVSAAYVIRDFSTADTSVNLRNEFGDLQKILK